MPRCEWCMCERDKETEISHLVEQGGSASFSMNQGSPEKQNQEGYVCGGRLLGGQKSLDVIPPPPLVTSVSFRNRPNLSFNTDDRDTEGNKWA